MKSQPKPILANPSSMVPAIPSHAVVKRVTQDEPATIDTSGELWTWNDAGGRHHIDWRELALVEPFERVAKAFIHHRLESRSAGTVASDAGMLRYLSQDPRCAMFPWEEKHVLGLMASILTKAANTAISFRMLYSWCVITGKLGFSLDTLYELEDIQIESKNAYESLFLQQEYLTPEDEMKILDEINVRDYADIESQEKNLLLHICFELAPRPTQIYGIDCVDFEVIRSSAEDAHIFYSLKVPKAKKRGAGIAEKVPKQISQNLGEKLERFINLVYKPEKWPHQPLFSAENKRKSAASISQAVFNAMRALNLTSKSGATSLRHHLGQGLADQGASADVIAEALGHNSTVAGRAYIAATPTIGTKKGRALGKNKTYKDLMSMMLTGEIAHREDFPPEQHVRGVIYMRLIKGIGGCDLAPEIQCPKNPISSCYNCLDFHPFPDGPHEEVRSSLEIQAQDFIDVSIAANELGESRVPLQLEQTIEAVDVVIARCAAMNSEGSADEE